MTFRQAYRSIHKDNNHDLHKSYIYMRLLHDFIESVLCLENSCMNTEIEFNGREVESVIESLNEGGIKDFTLSSNSHLLEMSKMLQERGWKLKGLKMVKNSNWVYEGREDLIPALYFVKEKV